MPPVSEYEALSKHHDGRQWSESRGIFAGWRLRPGVHPYAGHTLGPEEDVPWVNITGKNMGVVLHREGGDPLDSGPNWPCDIHMPTESVFLSFLIFPGRNLGFHETGCVNASLKVLTHTKNQKFFCFNNRYGRTLTK